VTAHPGWTPASRPGIVPLHPLGFGTILGRSFTALRQNPKVLLGFALCVQVVGYIVLILAVGGVAFWSFSRLDTLLEGSDEWNAVLAGSVAITLVTGVLLGMAVTALGVIVQGVVVAEVSREVVAEKETLGRLWARVRPAAWRLIGYTFLLALAAGVVIALLVLAVVAIGSLGAGGLVAAVILTILFVVGGIVVELWISTKLSLVPAVLVLERTTIRGAIVRSWRLIRGRFWPALGVIVIISLAISLIGQFVSIPFSLLTSTLSTVIAPTGTSGPTTVIGILVGGLLTEAVVLLIGAMGLVVQATAVSLIYVDCRMRHEGLDLDLLEYVEKRDAGERDLADPYTPHPERPHPPRPVFAPYGPPQPGAYPPPGYPPAGYPPPAAYPPAAYPPAAYPQAPFPPATAPGRPAYGAPAQPTHGAPAQPAYGMPVAPGSPPAPHPPQPPASPAVPAPEAPDATHWTAPGAPSDDAREAP